MKWLVTGGAGFIGCNVVRRLLAGSHDVVVLDDLSRRGSQENLDWIRTLGAVSFVRQDIRNAACYLQAVHGIERTAGRVYNIGGGPDCQLSLLEARGSARHARRAQAQPPVRRLATG